MCMYVFVCVFVHVHAWVYINWAMCQYTCTCYYVALHGFVCSLNGACMQPYWATYIQHLTGIFHLNTHRLPNFITDFVDKEHIVTKYATKLREYVNVQYVLIYAYTVNNTCITSSSYLQHVSETREWPRSAW